MCFLNVQMKKVKKINSETAFGQETPYSVNCPMSDHSFDNHENGGRLQDTIQTKTREESARLGGGIVYDDMSDD